MGVTPPRFDGRRYENPGESASRTMRELLRWQFTAVRRPWPAWVEQEHAVTPPGAVPNGTLALTFVNHSTFLLQTGGATILTDPVWSDRASPLPFAGPRRVHAPGVAFDRLPRIDVVLVSHNHYDHMDLHTLRRLEARDRPRFVTGTGNGPFLRARGLSRVDELTWWQSIDLGHCPPDDGAGAALLGANPVRSQPDAVGQFRVRRRLATRLLRRRHWLLRVTSRRCARAFGAIELALLPIGAYEPRWFMRPAHMNPADAVQAHLDLHARLSVAMHFGTFRLTDEARDNPPRHLGDALDARGVPRDTFRVLRPGETLIVPT